MVSPQGNDRQPRQGKPHLQQTVAAVAVVGDGQIRLHSGCAGRDLDGDGVDGGALLDAELAGNSADQFLGMSAGENCGEKRKGGYVTENGSHGHGFSPEDRGDAPHLSFSNHPP